MITIKETFKVLPKKLISQTYFILFFSIIVFFIEILGIGVFLPLLKILTDQNFIADNEKISNFILIFSFFDLNFSNFDEENIKRIKIIIGGIIIIIIVFFLKFIILTFHAYCLLRYRADIQAYLSSQLLKKYTKVSLNYYFFKNSSELLRNITTDVSHYSTTLMSILTIIAEIPIFIGIAIILLTQQPFSSLIALILFSIIIFLLYQSVKKKLYNYGKNRVEHEGKRINFINIVIEGFKDLKILGRSRNILNKFDFENKSAFDISVYIGLIERSQRFFLEFFLVMCLSTLIIILIPSVDDFSEILFTIGLYSVAMFRLLPSFSKILLNLNNIKASRVSFLKVFSDLNNIKDENERDTRIKLNFKDNIEIKSLSFKYTNREKNVLENINFSVKKGEMIGLIGESGSGKSTLIEIIMGFLKPINGEIKVDGKNIFDNLREWRNQIGYVTQNVFLIDDTILNNIALGVDPNEIDLDRIKDCIAQAKLEVFVKSLKDGLKTNCGDRGIQLSGGQKQRISIARAIYDNPEVLILDEATSSLDKKTEKEILNIVKNFKNNKTIILISHDLNSLKDCDSIYKIENKNLFKK